MSRRHEPPPALRVAPFSTADAAQHVTARALRSPAYQRLGRGARMLAGEEVTHGRRVQGFLAVLPSSTVLVERSAAWAHGVRLSDADDAVVVNVLPRGSARSRPHLQVRSQRLARADVQRTALGWATTPERTAADLLRTLPRDEAVVVVDALLRRTGTDPRRIGPVLDAAAAGRGVRAARAALALVDAGAESPRETLLRLALVDGGLPPPVVQHCVWHEGRCVARLDLSWPRVLVAAEYDGDHHRDRRTHSRDLARHNALRALGWVVVQVDARALARPEELVRLLGGLLASRADERV